MSNQVWKDHLSLLLSTCLLVVLVPEGCDHHRPGVRVRPADPRRVRRGPGAARRRRQGRRHRLDQHAPGNLGVVIYRHYLRSGIWPIA